MVIQLVEGTIEARIIHLLLEMYPVTTADLARELNARPDTIDRAVRALAGKGVVEIEPLPDTTYVRLARMDFAFLGRKESQRRRVKHEGGKTHDAPKDYDGPMFG